MRVCSSPISNQQKLIGGLVASAVLAFVVAFAKVRLKTWFAIYCASASLKAH